MHRVTSSDGTSIAYDRLGSGPAVVLVGGASADHAILAAELAAHFTVHNPDRRGDGAPPCAVERELEDLAALMEAAGGAAHLYGASSGGALALEAAAAGLPVARLAVYEVPYALAEDTPDEPADGLTLDRLTLDRLAKIHCPTLVATGPLAGGGFLDRAADAIAAALPVPERVVVQGTDPTSLATVLTRFFSP
ncbi:Alpha/beta hydrolase family protein [Nonomuraea coxensis DSM 45129]|uniref:Alpha/beta hydrolase family protein n=1 Tax=Nonomuraea coxensis DSM 45129 TaxID=1122611 RepID=A0ABX8TQG4_9ACTN|nr:alpha/beta fold hydrolase [Nonomuraea coxensis]QYC37735.1 Alpha/beta hydrolase family protein [Nonomuraea coxensis DSM 45129]